MPNVCKHPENLIKQVMYIRNVCKPPEGFDYVSIQKRTKSAGYEST